MRNTVDSLFLDYSIRKLEQCAYRIATCLDQLSDEQIWMRGGNSGAENAIGNLVLHLCGNVRQWIGTGVGELPDVRIREEEFAARGGLTRQDLQRRLTETVEAAAPIFARLTPERLITVVEVQSYRVTVLEAVYHVVEHFSHHTGQIVFATKLLTGADLGFYRHLAQPQHDETTP